MANMNVFYTTTIILWVAVLFPGIHTVLFPDILMFCYYWFCCFVARI